MSTTPRPEPAPRPAWFETLLGDFTRSVAHVFVLHGGIFDYVQQGLPLRAWLARVLGGPMEVVAQYSLDEGITFGTPSMRRRFEELLGLQAQAPASEAYAYLRGTLPAPAAEGVPLPSQPLEAIRLLLAFLRAAPPQRAAAIVDRLDLLVPAGDKALLPESRLALLGLLHRAGTDPELEERGNPLILLAPTLEELHPDVRLASSGLRAIAVPLPDYEARLTFIKEKLAPGAVRLAMPPQELAAQTAGLSRRHIEDVLLRAGGGAVSWELVRARKREIMAGEYAEVLEVLEPSLGFDGVGGHAVAKAFLARWVVEPLRRGLRDMVPLGVALTGPPGTGKTLIATALAREAGVNCVLLRAEKIKGGIVGESERRLARAIAGVESLAPCLVFVDEIDQRFRRGQGGGDGGSAVESNLFGRLLEFLGDPAHRGQIVALAATNRPDLVDPALFRAGRFDVKVPILPPEDAQERADVFAALLRRSGHTPVERAALLALGERTEGWTGAELEQAVVKATGLARLEGRDIAAALQEALALLRPATRDVQLMTRLAIAECNDLSLLPPRYRALLEDRGALDEEIGQLRERERKTRALAL